MQYTYSTKGLSKDEITLCNQFEKQYLNGEIVNLDFLKKAINKTGLKTKESFNIWDYWKQINSRYVHDRKSLVKPVNIEKYITYCNEGDLGALWLRMPDHRHKYARLKPSFLEDKKIKERLSFEWHPYLEVINDRLYLKYSSIIGGFMICKFK